MIVALCLLILLTVILGVLFFVRNNTVYRLKLEKEVLNEKLSLLKNELDSKERKEAEDESRFRLLATQILSDKSEEMMLRNETRLSELLMPLKEDINKFGKVVSDCYQSEARERFSLQERIKELVNINQVLGKEAKELTSALKGNNRVQGQWGELVLENVLEKSGLRKNEEYFIQESFNSDPLTTNISRLRPDVIVRYPGSKCVVIDSKASLNAFVEYVNASDENDRSVWGHKHLESVRRHIDELSKKSYENLTRENGADFVMMFIPNDTAYMTAMQLDPELWQKAYEKNIIVVSPTLLIGALKLIAQQWNQDRHNRNALEIASLAGRMYDKFVGFTEDMEKIDSSINSLSRTYSDAMKKLRDGNGSLISRAHKLKDLGAKASKQIKNDLIED